MIARIQIGENVFIDARHVPIALIALFEGWPTGLIACAGAVIYRMWQGGYRAWAGVAGLVAAGLLAGAAPARARPGGAPRARPPRALSPRASPAPPAPRLPAGPRPL